MTKRLAVYVASADAKPNLFKIGISTQPEMRAVGLSSECRAIVEMHATVWLEERAARDLERRAHSVLTRMGVHEKGEWFRGSVNVGMWGLYEALRTTWGNYDLVEKAARRTPLLDWGIGYHRHFKLVVPSWDKINGALAVRTATPK